MFVVCTKFIFPKYFIWATTRQNVSSRVSDQVRLKLACSATAANIRLEILVTETRDFTLYRQWTTKALIRLRGCAGWSVPLLFAYDIRHIFSWPGSYILVTFPLVFYQNRSVLYSLASETCNNLQSSKPTLRDIRNAERNAPFLKFWRNVSKHCFSWFTAFFSTIWDIKRQITSTGKGRDTKNTLIQNLTSAFLSFKKVALA